jgi:hypothetical protein
MHAEKDGTGEEQPPSAGLAALVILTGAIIWCAAIYFEQGPHAVRLLDGVAPLGGTIVFGAVGTFLLAAGAYGLWRSFRRPRGTSDGGSSDPGRCAARPTSSSAR